jgi:hypothetical protein
LRKLNAKFNNNKTKKSAKIPENKRSKTPLIRKNVVDLFIAVATLEIQVEILLHRQFGVQIPLQSHISLVVGVYSFGDIKVIFQKTNNLLTLFVQDHRR